MRVVIRNRLVDVVVVGGGLAGSVLAGVLARAGVRVLVAEKERRFRDRIRGEATYPWGMAEAVRLGLAPLFQQAGGVELVAMRVAEDTNPAETYHWAATSVDGLNEIGFSHHRLQEVAFCWAESMGATVRRPAKVTDFWHGGMHGLHVREDPGHLPALSGQVSASDDDVQRQVLVRLDRDQELRRRRCDRSHEPPDMQAAWVSEATCGVSVAARRTS